MQPLTFGLNRRPFGTIAKFVETVRREESLGFDYSWFPDSQMRLPDAFVLAGLALQATSTIRGGPLLANPVTRHPSTIANAAATLDLIAPGRAAVGIGGGDTAVFTIGLRPAKVAEVASALRLTRALLRGEAPDQGARRAVSLATHGSAELWGAASGPRAAAAAGAYADVIVLRCGVDPANLNFLADAAEAGARAAGREPGDLRFASICHMLMHDDPAQARAQAGLVAAGFHELSRALWPRAGREWNGPQIHEIARQVYPDIVHAEDVATAARLTSFVTDEAAASFALWGDEHSVAEGLNRMRAGFPRLWHVIPQPLDRYPAFPERVAQVMQTVR
ncbi:MAG: LLM class flavin-dependent oxidoreductase [Dehalococcoidia bacterium]